MPPFRARVTEIATIAGHLRVRWQAGDGPAAAPGQFYLARAARSSHPVLRLPVFAVAAPPAGHEFWIDPDHPYAALEPEDPLDLVGPLGRGVKLPDRASRLLMISQSLARLWPLAVRALAQGWSLAWLWPEGAPEGMLEVLPPVVEVAQGAVAADLAEWADLAVLDVPDPAATARRLRRLCPLKPAGFVQAFRLPTLPCGFGGCQACWVETARGRRLACVDGPVMEV
jgi:hypothetical protein